MTLGFVGIRTVGEADDRLLPTPDERPNSIVYEAADGPRVMFAVATALDVQVPSGDKLSSIATVTDIKATLFVTDSRLAFSCTRHDKGGGWIGSPSLALALNAVSMAWSSHRSRGTALTGQVRYAWLSAIGGSEKQGSLSRESLRVVTRRSIDGRIVPVYLDFTLPADISSTAIAAEVARRAARFRLDAGEGEDDEEARTALESLARATTLASSKGRFALHQFPGCWPASERSVELARLLLEKRAGRVDPAPPSIRFAVAETPDSAPAPSAAGPPDQGSARVCGRCGSSVADGLRFCEECGTPVTSITATVPVAAAAAVPVLDPAAGGEDAGSPGEADDFPSAAPDATGLDEPGEPPMTATPAAEEALLCRGCGRAMTSDMRFCGACGSPAETPGTEQDVVGPSKDADTAAGEVPPADAAPTVCQGCGAEVTPQMRFCGECGIPAAEAAPAAQVSRDEESTADVPLAVGGAAIAAVMAAGQADPVAPTGSLPNGEQVEQPSDDEPVTEALDGAHETEPDSPFVDTSALYRDDVEPVSGVGVKDEVAATALRPAVPADVCPRCGGTLVPGGAFCGDCGTRTGGSSLAAPPAAVVSTCRRCGELLEPGSLFCGSCGTQVGGGTPDGPAPSAPTARKRRRWPLVAVLTVLLAAAVTAGVIWGLPLLRGDDTTEVAAVEQRDDQTDQQADEEVSATSDVTPTVTPTPTPVDPSTRLTALAQAGARELGTVPTGTWVPQVSSKCAPLTSADLEDGSGRVGWPDGTPEAFPTGLSDAQILAFHEGLATRLGATTDELVLVTPADLGIDGPPPAVCGSAPIWISLLVSEQSSTQGGALDFCTFSGLPSGECAARKIGPDTDFVLPTGNPPAPGDANTYPILADTFLSVRTSPSTDAPEVGRVPAGGYVTIVCTVQGPAVTDPFGDVITLWDRISRPFDGYVSDAFVDTGGRPPVMPPC